MGVGWIKRKTMSILGGWNLFWSFPGGLTLPLWSSGDRTPPPTDHTALSVGDIGQDLIWELESSLFCMFGVKDVCEFGVQVIFALIRRSPRF